MKSIRKCLSVTLTAIAASCFIASAQVPRLNTGVGPAIAGSYNPNELPERALDFLRDYYGSHYAQSCEKDYMTENYELTMTDGTGIEFDYQGKVMEIDAPDHSAISKEAVKNILPGKVYKKLTELGVEDKVEKIDREKRGFDIEFTDGSSLHELFITSEGKLLAQK